MRGFAKTIFLSLNTKVLYKHDKIAPFLFVWTRGYTQVLPFLNMSMRVQNSYIWQVKSGDGF